MLFFYFHFGKTIFFKIIVVANLITFFYKTYSKLIVHGQVSVAPAVRYLPHPEYHGATVKKVK